MNSNLREISWEHGLNMASCYSSYCLHPLVSHGSDWKSRVRSPHVLWRCNFLSVGHWTILDTSSIIHDVKFKYKSMEIRPWVSGKPQKYPATFLSLQLFFLVELEEKMICWNSKVLISAMGSPLQYSGLQNSMDLYSPWGHKESDMTERILLHFTSLYLCQILISNLLV